MTKNSFATSQTYHFLVLSTLCSCDDVVKKFKSWNT